MTLSSSFQSLSESIHEMNQVIEISSRLPPDSPTTTCSTRLSGATHSSQQPGTSTRELLHESAARRRHREAQRFITPPSSEVITYSPTSESPETPVRHVVHPHQQHVLSPSVATDDSWDAIESPPSKLLRRLKHQPYDLHSSHGPVLGENKRSVASSGADLIAEIKPETDLDDKRQTKALRSVSSSQEVEVLAASLPRPPHFQQWLDGITAMSSRDGVASTIESYAASVVSAAASNTSSLSSFFETASEAAHLWTPDSAGSDESFDDVLNPGDFSFESEESIEFGELTGEVAQQIGASGQVPESTSHHTEKEAEPVAEPLGPEAPVKPSAFKWKLVSAGLAAGWLASIAILLRTNRSPSTDTSPALIHSFALNTSTINYIPDYLELENVFEDASASLTTFYFTAFAVITAALSAYYKLNSVLVSKRHPYKLESMLLSEKNPNDILWAHENFPHAVEYYNRSQLLLAETIFKRIVDSSCLPKQKRQAMEYLGRTLYRLGRGENASARLKSSRTAFEKCLDLDRRDGFGRKSALAMASKGRTLFRLEKYHGARVVLKHAIELDESIAFAHEYLAKTYARMDVNGSDQLVIRTLKKSLEIDPDRYSARVFLGEYIYQNASRLSGAKTLHQFSLAEEHLEHVVSTRPDHVSAHVQLALLAQARGEREKEAAHWRKVLVIRQEGQYDFDLSIETNDYARGFVPALALCLALDLKKEHERFERIRVLEELIEIVELEKLPVIFRAIAIMHVNEEPILKDIKIKFAPLPKNEECVDADETRTVVDERQTRSKSSAALRKPKLPPQCTTTIQATQCLESEVKSQLRRASKTASYEKVEAHGLAALALFALGRERAAMKQALYFEDWREAFHVNSRSQTPATRDAKIKCALIEKALEEMGWKRSEDESAEA